MLKLRRLYYIQVNGFTYLPLWENTNNQLYTWNEMRKQLAFLITSSTPSLKKYCTTFNPLFLAE